MPSTSRHFFSLSALWSLFNVSKITAMLQSPMFERSSNSLQLQKHSRWWYPPVYDGWYIHATGIAMQRGARRSFWIQDVVDNMLGFRTIGARWVACTNDAVCCDHYRMAWCASSNTTDRCPKIAQPQSLSLSSEAAGGSAGGGVQQVSDAPDEPPVYSLVPISFSLPGSV